MPLAAEESKLVPEVAAEKCLSSLTPTADSAASWPTTEAYPPHLTARGKGSSYWFCFAPP